MDFLEDTLSLIKTLMLSTLILLVEFFSGVWELFNNPERWMIIRMRLKWAFLQMLYGRKLLKKLPTPKVAREMHAEQDISRLRGSWKYKKDEIDKHEKALKEWLK